jgi:hypothetical protein
VDCEPLTGGHVTAVTRIGDTIRRTPPPDPDFTRRLLGLLESRDWPGAPRYLGIDPAGRQILSYLPGHVAWAARQPPDVTSDESLAGVARLVRELHDLTAGTPLAAGQEAVCHNDLSPANTVYRDDGDGLRPVAFIDWDLAAPGDRQHDVAHVCWQFAGLGPGRTDIAVAGHALRVICAGYGIRGGPGLIDTILWWQDRCWRGIVSQAAVGDPAMIRLCESGAADDVRMARDWVCEHRAELGRQLS